MPDKPRYYWDACIWIALIKRERGRYESCQFVIDKAEAGEVEIWTSAFTLAEVFKRKCSGDVAELETAKDTEFEDYIVKDFVVTVQVDVDVGTAARRLLRAHPEIGKPQDAVHLATALLSDIDELHTFDKADLLGLNGLLNKADGSALTISHPPSPPPPPPSLFDSLVEDFDGEDERQAGANE